MSTSKKTIVKFRNNVNVSGTTATMNDENESDLIDIELDKTINVSADELNSTMYKSDYKKFRDHLDTDTAKYHRLETWYGKFVSYCSFGTWLLSITSFLLSGSGAALSTMIAKGNQI